MSEAQTEAQVEDAFIAAVMAPDEQALDAPKLETTQDVNEEEGEPELEEKPEAKAAKEEEAPEEDEVEIPGEDGKEPTRLKVADLVASHQAYERLRGQEAQIIERAQHEATQRTTAHYQQVEQHTRQVAANMQAALQLLQKPQPPNAEAMLNPASPQYDPDNFHRTYAMYQRAIGQWEQGQALGKQLIEDAQVAQELVTEAREIAELNRALRVWPEFNEPQTQNQFISDMGKAYGYSPQELDASLTDHRNLQVARDALAYRAMKAQSGDVKAKVEAKAPKLVRSKQEAKGSSAQARGSKGQFVTGAFGQAMKSRSDGDWANVFAGMAKAGAFDEPRRR